MSGLDFDAIVDQVVSHALTLAIFERVNAHEPENAPGNGLSAAVWIDTVDPAVSASGLASTSVRLVLKARLFTALRAGPLDGIDSALMRGLKILFAAYTSDFELGGNVRNIDLLGAYGIPLSARAGYLTQDNKPFRIMDISLPLIVDDVFDQAP